MSEDDRGVRHATARAVAVAVQLASASAAQRATVLAAAGSPERLGELARLSPADRTALGVAVPESTWHGLDEVLGASERSAAAVDATIITVSDDEYPERLLEIRDPPLALWVRARRPRVWTEGVPVAMVGPRRPTPYGLAVADRLAADLAAAGVLLVSGGARGVDGRAHAAALKAGAPTVAVLGCGVDVCYPPEHGRLFEQVVENGCLVSELAPGTRPLAAHFPVRNRILAGLARAIVVVEATMRSGSLITARLGLEQGRDVLAVPGPITSPESQGTNELLALGAPPCRHAADVLAELRPDERALLEGAPWRRRTAVPEAAADDPDALLLALPPGEAVDLDDLAVRAGLPVGELLARLTAHELAGRVERLAGSRFLRRLGPSSSRSDRTT